MEKARGYQTAASFAIQPPDGFDQYLEEGTREIVWLPLLRIAHVSDAARALFSGGSSARNQYAAELQAYIRQAKAYDDAARNVKGTSAALLNYYCLLNLAKAELMIRDPAQIFGRKIRHGLSVERSKTTSIRGDRVVVGNGVFKLLYEQRTGVPIEPGTKLSVTKLLERVPEVGRDVTNLTGTPSVVEPVIHSVVANEWDRWPLIGLFLNGANVLENRETRRVLLASFEPIELDVHNWQHVFSRKSIPRDMAIFQAKDTYPADKYSLQYVGEQSARMLAPYFDYTTNDYFDGYIMPSVYKTKALPMSQSLARYATMFYVSYLVRYFPSRLSFQKHGEGAWLLSVFTESSDLPGLTDALCGITQRPHRFDLWRART